MLKPIVELNRLVSVSPEPHSVATDGRTVWIASRETRRVDVIDKDTWRKTGEIEPPGMPWGMTFHDGAVVMTCGEGEDDDRRIRSYVPGSGFQADFIACPENTGSHLASYGAHLLLAQWYKQKLLLLNKDGEIEKSFDAPHGVAGVTVAGDSAYLVGTDDEDEGEYWITRLDLIDGGTQDVATIPFHARGLAWDGSHFWSNHRAGNRAVSFDLPG
ncbi:MAG TPA: hypothetical protein VGN11_03320 [Candidatus Baltobacteraceae bacterium]|jgi:hypothetical protein|nr:hypothetical protein [Candidatus Baltobacteraceae bacterium]